MRPIRTSLVTLLVVLTLPASAFASVRPAASHGTVTTGHVHLTSASQSAALEASGYNVLPQPQKVTYAGKSFQITSGWHISLGAGVSRSNSAVTVLQQDLATRDGLHLHVRQSHNRNDTIVLQIKPGSVAVGHATDKNRTALAEQAYRLQLTSSGVTVTANASTGLMYGADTLIQLVKPTNGAYDLPVATITDWPDVELRDIFWDNSFKLDRPATIKQAIQRAAFYKANGFVLKLNGHFQFKSAPALVQPYALSPSQLQGITDYGLRYHVQVIPYVDGPGHDFWILGHPQYAGLREYPGPKGTNFESCSTNPKTYNLLHSLYQDLLNANKGSHWFVASTDEPYYVGLADNSQCDEKTLATKLGSVGKVEAQFLYKSTSYLHNRGREVQFWGEFPIAPGDISSLPHWLIDGEQYGNPYDRLYTKHGIREMIYAYGQGAESLFPHYYVAPGASEMPVIQNMYNTIKNSPNRTDGGDVMGVFVANWGDAGLHPATFWMAIVLGASWAWNPASPNPQEAASRFYPLFYGPGTVDMQRVYQLMSTQAAFYDSSWNSVPVNWLPKDWGDSNGRFNPPRPCYGGSIPLLGVPTAKSLKLRYNWSVANAQRLKAARQSLKDNNELLSLLQKNERSVRFQRYGMQVFKSIAGLERQNLEMLTEFGNANAALKQAQHDAQGNPAAAVRALDRALETAQKIRDERNAAFHQVLATWNKSEYLNVGEANGRSPINENTNVNCGYPTLTTVDMTYLFLRELHVQLGEWYGQVQSVRNQYAQAHGLPTSSVSLAWSDVDRFGSQGSLGSRPAAVTPGRAVISRVLAPKGMSPASGTVNALSVYLGKGDTSRTVVAGIYADDHNHPGRLIAQGRVMARAGAWNTVHLNLPVTVTENHAYWIAVLGGHGRLILRDQSSNGLGSEPVEVSRLRPQTKLPATWSATGAIAENGPVLAYAKVHSADVGGQTGER